MVENRIYTKEMLTRMSTEQLVGLIRYHRYYGKYEECIESWENYHLPEDFEIPNRENYILVGSLWDDHIQVADYWADETELREILKTRPNIPNKIQKKRIRQEGAASARRHSKKILKYKR